MILSPTTKSSGPILWKRLYTTYIRSHLEYSVAASNPYKNKKQATKVSHLPRKLSYEERLINLNLTTLSARRERGNLIQLYKIEKNIDHVNWVVPCMRGAPRRNTRGIMRKPIIANCQQRTYFFTNRVINNWNALPDSVVEEPNTNPFKNRLDNFQHGYNSSHSTDWALHVRR